MQSIRRTSQFIGREKASEVPKFSALIVVLLALICTRSAFAGPLVESSFESTMRAFQERYSQWDGNRSPAPPASSLLSWPNAGDGTNPGPFPADGFYAQHSGGAGVSAAFNAAVQTMVSKFSTVAQRFTPDELWLVGRSSDSGYPNFASIWSSSYFSSLSSRTATETFSEIRGALSKFKWTSSVSSGGTVTLGNHLQSQVQGSYPSSAEAWIAAQVMSPRSPVNGVRGILSKSGNPPEWYADQIAFDVTKRPSSPEWKGGTAHWFVRATGNQLAAPSQFPNNNTYVAQKVGSSSPVGFRILIPNDVLTNGGTVGTEISISDHVIFEPDFTHSAGGAPPADTPQEPEKPKKDSDPDNCDGAKINSAHYRWSVGSGQVGEVAGSIKLEHQAPSVAWYSPDSLTTPENNGFKTIRDSARHVLQVYGPTVVVDVANVTALGYEMKFYHRDLAWPFTTDGRIVTAGTPYLIAAVSNPDGTGLTANRLLITDTQGTQNESFEFEFTGSLSQWKLTRSEEPEIETLTRSQVNASGEWTEDRILSLPGGTVISHLRETRKNFAWGSEIISSIEDPNGAARTTEYIYSVTEGYQSYGKLKQKILPNGGWEKYSYDGIRRIKKIVSNYQNSPITAPDNECRVTEFIYPSDITPATDYTITTHKVLGVEVARVYHRHFWDGYDTIVTQSQGAGIGATDNLITKRRNYLSTIFAGRVKSITRPDGTMAIYEYQANAPTLAGMTELTTIVSDGKPNASGTDITDGTRTTTLTNRQVHVIFKSVMDIVSGAIIDHRVATQVDNFDRPVTQSNLDGTSDMIVYNCCRVESVVDKRGVQVSFDQSPGVKERSSLGVTWKDKTVGREQVETRTGTDAVEMEISREEYNIAGELVRTVIPASGTTLRALEHSATESITTLLRPDGGTEVRKSWLDGTLKSITGTSVFPKRYEYGVNANGTRWTKEIALDNAGNDTAEWVKTTTDAVGRIILAEHADGAVSGRFYNSKNQLIRSVDPDGVVMLYAYDDRGRLWRAAVDMDRDGMIDLDGTDRITETSSIIATRPGGRVVNRATVKVWTTDNDANATVITSITDAAVDGLDSWTVAGGVETHTQTIYQGAGAWEERTTYGDSSLSVSTYVGGRLSSVARKTDANAVIASTTYFYDAKGRVRQTVDARGGVTDIVYDNGDRVQSVTGPDPGDGHPRPVTTYGYDAAGRQGTSLDVGGGTLTTLFNPNGTVQSTGGTRDYPLNYTYSSQGRMETMTSAKGVTSWQYIPTNGLLWKKFDAGILAWTYGYTLAGRLQSRINGRGITTTYGYDFAGTQESVDYSDATPNIGYTFNRLGQVRTASRGGITRTLDLNVWGQLTQESWSGSGWDGLRLVHGRDAWRRRDSLTLLNVNQALTSQGFGFDGASRLSSVTSGSTDAATYAYIPGSSLIDTVTFSYQSQVKAVSDRTYNLAGRLEEIRTVNAANATLAKALYQHDSLDRRTRVTRADGSRWDWGYNDRSEVTSSAHSFADQSAHPLRQYGYAYDGIGNRLTSTRSGHTETYATNSRNQYTQRTVPGIERVEGEAGASANVIVNGQLVERRGPAFWKEWTADNTASARWDLVKTIAAKPGAGPAGEDLVTVKEGHLFLPQTPEAFLYDDDGNLTQDGRWNRTWDGENRLVSAETRPDLPGSVPRVRLEYDYDDAGRRVGKRVLSYDPTTSTYGLNKALRYIYDGWNLVAEIDVSPNLPASGAPHLLRSYSWGADLSGSQRGAGGIGGLLFATVHGSTGTGRFVPAYDGNGNITAWLEAGTGTVSTAMEYDAFGNLLAVMPRPVSSATAAATIPFGFSTKYRDSETDTLYYGYRDYSPSLARWLNKDPLGEAGGVNLYGFVGNDGVNWVDALGLSAESHSVTGPGGQRYTQDHPFFTQTDECGQLWAYLDLVDVWVKLTSSDDPCCKLRNKKIIEGPRWKQHEREKREKKLREPEPEKIDGEDQISAWAEEQKENTLEAFRRGWQWAKMGNTMGLMSVDLDDAVVEGVKTGLRFLRLAKLGKLDDAAKTGPGAASIFDEAFATNRRFTGSPKHAGGPYTRGGDVVNPEPANGQAALDFSFEISPNSTRRIGVDPATNQIVVLDRTGNTVRNGQVVGGDYHGHVRTYDQLSQPMRNTLNQNGISVGKDGSIRLDPTMWGGD